ncbi:zinc-dependent peptidase [Breznakia pachnodae]|uniref:F0F1-type ATP synthase assembly protein I n=1 Tax=Breznakia pachnodae TaxID=265178 RepID=A0ABU0E3H2_9FIRM|nr:zinc-dependent peptidase [Breznakia pachnodae]MDQ0361040.1 F0F1-type ATP synthase assembly protein I [Breznakia pachnodae]
MKRKVIMIAAVLSVILCLVFLGSIALSNSDGAYGEMSLMIPNIPSYGIVIYAVVITAYIIVSMVRRRRADEEGRNPRRILLPIVILTVVLGVLIASGNREPQRSGYDTLADIKDGDYLEMDDLPPINIVGDISEDKIDYIIRECIENQPEILLKETKLIHLCTHDEFESLKERMNVKQAIAFATSIDNNIYVDSSIYGLQRVITHELAHNYDFRNGYISGQSWFKAKYESMIKDDRFNSLHGVIDIMYARSDASEFFAEVSDAYFNRPHHLKKDFPELYELFNGIYKEE